VKDSLTDTARVSSPPTTDMECDLETLADSGFAETATSAGNCSQDTGKTDNVSASNCLDMDDIMEYLQCQDASLLENTATQNVSSVNASLSNSFASDGNNSVLPMSDNLPSSTLSLAALQQLASECSTIDLSSLAMDSNVPFVGSNRPASGKSSVQLLGFIANMYPLSLRKVFCFYFFLFQTVFQILGLFFVIFSQDSTEVH